MITHIGNVHGNSGRPRHQALKPHRQRVIQVRGTVTCSRLVTMMFN